MRIYVCGPMTGKKWFNFPAFDDMAVWIQKSGHIAVSPADLDRKAGLNLYTLGADYDWSVMPPGMDLASVVERDMHALLSCDGYILLDGWEDSKGAKAEKGVLDWRGTPRLDPERNFVVWEEVTPCDKANPKDALGLKKAPLRLAPWVAIIYLSKAMEIGAVKYSAWNWRKTKIKASVYYEAALRHLAALVDGQDNDPESNLPHEAHVLANMAILLDAKAADSLIDDRDKTGAVAKLLGELNGK